MSAGSSGNTTAQSTSVPSRPKATVAFLQETSRSFPFDTSKDLRRQTSSALQTVESPCCDHFRVAG